MCIRARLGEPATIENTVMPVLSTVWIVGMAVLALYTVISYFRLRRRLDTACLLYTSSLALVPL